MNKNTLRFAAALTVCLAMLNLISGCAEQQDVGNKVVELIRPAKVTLVKTSNDNAVRYFPATIEPTLDAMLAFRINGELATLNVVGGQAVEQGEVLAKLDDEDFILQLKQAQAKYDLALSQHTRAISLFADKLISQATFDESLAQLDIALAQLDVAKRNTQYTKILAPFAGTVAQVFIENYEFVQAKQPIIELQGREQVDVSIEVPESLMARLPKTDDGKLYQPSLILDAVPDKQYKVMFKEHDITANKTTRTYRVVFTLNVPQDVNLLAGMTGQLMVELDKVMAQRSEALVVPISAIFVPNQFAGQKKQFVYRLDRENRVQLVEIDVIKIAQHGTQIKAVNDDLKAGDKIIAAGSHYINPGQVVRPWLRERGL